MNRQKSVNLIYLLIAALTLIILYKRFKPKRCPKCPACTNTTNTETLIEPSQDSSTTTKKSNVKKIALYHASWCGHCNKFMPEWRKFDSFVKKNFKDVQVVTVKCDGDGENECAKNSVEGYPTVLVTDKNNIVTKYNGERSKQGLTDFISN